jgi:hypothetical protein
MDQRPYRRRSGFVGPLILITLGVIFLLSNLGLLNWNVWDLIWRLWPVLLIAIGLDLLFGRRSALGALISLVLVIALIGGAVWYAATQLPIATGQALTTDRIAQERADATSADVRISFGAGQLRIGALKDSGNLIEGTVVTGPGERVLRDFRVEGGVARLALHSEGVPLGPWPWRRHEQERRWSLDLSPSVPMALNVSTGVGESLIDLSALKVTDLKVSSGVGKTEVKLPSRGRVQAKISGGVGQLIITIPEGMAARIHASAGIGGVSVPSHFSRQEGDYVVGNYAAAEDRIDLDISGGVGQVIIR